MKSNIKQLRETIVRGSHDSKEGHVPSALSILDILWILYDKVLYYDPTNGNSSKRDYFILSKGHSSLGLYAVLVEKGLIDKKELAKFCAFDSPLGGHPDRNKLEFVEASTGSLGHGFPIAAGIALGLKMKDKKNKVYTIVGDGEANEGTVWETALLAAHHKLDNLCAIIDFNHSTDRALEVGNLEAKFKAFGWDTYEIDGHDQDQILMRLEEFKNKKGAPTVLIANTTKGKGIRSMENNPAWHHKSPSADELPLLINEIQEYD